MGVGLGVHKFTTDDDLGLGGHKGSGALVVMGDGGQREPARVGGAAAPARLGGCRALLQVLWVGIGLRDAVRGCRTVDGAFSCLMPGRARPAPVTLRNP